MIAMSNRCGHGLTPHSKNTSNGGSEGGCFSARLQHFIFYFFGTAGLITFVFKQSAYFQLVMRLTRGQGLARNLLSTG